MELLEHITYEGKSATELMKDTSIPKVSLYRQLNKLIEDKQIIKDDKMYRKLREVPSVGSILDSLTLYHQQKLMDYKYRRRTKEQQQDECLVWLINGTFIKGKIEEYNEELLEQNINHAYNSFIQHIK